MDEVTSRRTAPRARLGASAWLGCALLLLLAAGCASVAESLRSPPPAPATHSALEQEAIDLINGHRREHGLNELDASDVRLSDVIRQASAALAAGRDPRLGREGRARLICNFDAFAELSEHYGSQILGEDPRETLHAIVATWLATPEIRTVIKGEVDAIGVGVSAGPDGVLHAAAVLLRDPSLGSRHCRLMPTKYDS